MKQAEKNRIQRIAGRILMVSLLLSIFFCIFRLICPPVAGESARFVRTRSDYTLMLIQCLLGLAVMSLPSVLARKWKLMLPSFIHVLYYAFLYCAIFLGEVFSFYYLVPHWDTILHSFSGAMLAALGFILVDHLNKDEHVRVSLSPAFVALFAFCFALALGGVWEIYEYLADGLLGLNMQKFILEDGTVLSGRLALQDTMDDLIVDAIAAGVVSLAGFITSPARRQKKKAVQESAKQP